MPPRVRLVQATRVADLDPRSPATWPSLARSDPSARARQGSVAGAEAGIDAEAWSGIGRGAAARLARHDALRGGRALLVTSAHPYRPRVRRRRSGSRPGTARRPARMPSHRDRRRRHHRELPPTRLPCLRHPAPPAPPSRFDCVEPHAATQRKAPRTIDTRARFMAPPVLCPLLGESSERKRAVPAAARHGALQAAPSLSGGTRPADGVETGAPATSVGQHGDAMSADRRAARARAHVTDLTGLTFGVAVTHLRPARAAAPAGAAVHPAGATCSRRATSAPSPSSGAAAGPCASTGRCTAAGARASASPCVASRAGVASCLRACVGLRARSAAGRQHGDNRDQDELSRLEYPRAHHAPPRMHSNICGPRSRHVPGGEQP